MALHAAVLTDFASGTWVENVHWGPASDLRIAAASAKFLMAFANVGLTADTGASWTLPRLIGYGRAMEMMLLAQPVTAEAE